MTTQIPFSKYEGAGNDFVAIDVTSSELKLTSGQLSRLCQRKTGVGADGVLALERSEVPGCAYKLVYYNADGHEGSLCGNGSRCSLAFAQKIGLVSFGNTEDVSDTNSISDSNTILFEACDGIHRGGIKFTEQELQENGGLLYFVDIRDVRLSGVKKLSDRDYFLNNGSPHHVRFVDDDVDLDQYDVYAIGKDLRWTLYGKEGANINFVKMLEDDDHDDDHDDDDGKDCGDDGDEKGKTRKRGRNRKSTQKESTSKTLRIKIRTFERGVEDETLACGTGATASSIVAFLRHQNQRRNHDAQNCIPELETHESFANERSSKSKCDTAHESVTCTQVLTPHRLNVTEARQQNTMTTATVFVDARGGELQVSFSFDGETFSDIKLHGATTHVFDGVIFL